MPLGGNAQAIPLLRRLIARMEGEGEADPAPGEARPEPRIPLGGASFWLDQALGGGLRSGALYEAAPAGAGDQGAVYGFALALALRFALRRPGPLIWVLEEAALREWGAPYGPGLRDWGFDPGRLVLVRTADGQSALWALEEALKCGACAAAIGEIWRFGGRSSDEAPVRRLAFAARRSGTPGLLLHPRALGGAKLEASGVQARFAVAAAPDREPSEGGAPDLFRSSRFAVQVLKTRFEAGRVLVWNPEIRRLAAWRPAQGLFEEPAAAFDGRPKRAGRHAG